MAGIVYRRIDCLVTNAGVLAKGGVRPLEDDLGLIRKAALAYSPAKGVVWVGPDRSLPKTFRRWKSVDASGLTAYPGLVDAHTHPVFAGDRSLEFELRMRGATYQEIAAAGGGIATSVRSTRAATSPALGRSLVERLERAKAFGVRLLEAKSGYGLDFATELRSLEVIRGAQKKVSGIEVVATCLAAHAIPPERKNDRALYLREIEEKILPLVAKKKLADYVDVFCDQGYFSVEETMRLVARAHQLGLKTRLHGEELAHTGIAARGAEAGVHSVDHLLKVDEKGIAALARSGTVAVLLPGTSFYLREKPAPARELIDKGVVVAVATDFNPGTCPTQNLPFIGSLAAITLGMTTAEIIAALTWNGARSLRKEKEYGALLPGFRGAPAFAKGDHPSALFYNLAPAALPDPSRTR